MSAPSQESRSCYDGYKMDIISHEGQHWFKAADVTRHLGYKNGRQAVITFVKAKDRPMQNMPIFFRKDEKITKLIKLLSYVRIKLRT